jgi:hypothetical protein
MEERRSSPAGGYDFPADPDKNADENPVFWLPEVHTSTVILTESATKNESAVRFRPDRWRAKVRSRQAADGLFLIVSACGKEHRIWIPNPPAKDALLGASIPLDDSTESRAEAAIRFYQHIRGANGPSRPNLSPQRLKRFALALRALDGWEEGESYRGVATTLFGSARTAAEPWKTASIRDVTIRLVRTGRQMMAGGYLDLLRG